MPTHEAEASADVDIDAKLKKQQEASEQAIYAHKVKKLTKAQKNRQLVRDHLKSTIPKTPAAEAADVHMQDNYIQPASHDIHNEPEPIPTAGGEPIVMPIIEPVTSSRRRVRRKEKEKR